MPYPIKDNFRKNDMLRSITARWLNWVSSFFNKTTWQGLIFTPTSSGKDCTIKISVDGTTIELSGSPLALRIVAGSITESLIADAAVTAAKLANTAVTEGTYTAVDLTVDAQGRITAAASGEISSSEIATGAVTAIKIQGGAVTSSKTSGQSGTDAMGIPGSNLHFTNGLLTSTS